MIKRQCASTLFKQSSIKCIRTNHEASSYRAAQNPVGKVAYKERHRGNTHQLQWLANHVSGSSNALLQFFLGEKHQLVMIFPPDMQISQHNIRKYDKQGKKA